MKRFAVLTSGGDAPGMNATIRAVVRAGIDKGFEVYGVHHGFVGLMDGDWKQLDRRDVGGIMQRGGTVLGSARSQEFKTAAGRERAIEKMKESGIEALVIIGGNGTQTGSYELSQMGFPVVGVASTIDNDLFGCDITLGVDTALNVALDSIDQLRNTAASHHRAFLVEVMGRNCGYLALMTAIAGGAEAVVIPEAEIEPDAIAAELSDAYSRGKSHAIVVVAEGSRNNAAKLLAHFQEHHERFGFQLRATILGYVQRGGNPGAFDRILGTELGASAVEFLANGQFGQLVGRVRGEIIGTPLDVVVSSKKTIDPSLLKFAEILAR